MKHLSFFIICLFFTTVSIFPDVMANMVSILYCSPEDESDFSHFQSITPELMTDYEKALYYYYQGRYVQKFKSKRDYSRYLKDMLRGKVLSLQHYTKDVDRAIACYKQALQYIDSEKKKANSAELTALKAEVMSHYSLIERFKLIVELGLAVEPTAQEALNLDPNNIRAQMVIASARAYSPKIYGGDPEEGILLFTQMISSKKSRNRLTDEQLFNVYAGIAFSWLRKRDPDQARPWLKKAGRIYPDSLLLTVLNEWD